MNILDFLHFIVCDGKFMRCYARVQFVQQYLNSRLYSIALSDHASNEFERMKPVCLREESLLSGLVDWC